MPLSWFIAIRMLRQQASQTLLMIVGVGVGVGVTVFISALISGLQKNLIDTTLSAQAHLSVHPLEERARPLLGGDGEQILRRTLRPEQRIRSIAQWQKVEAAIAALPQITSTAPSAVGAGFAIRGNASRPIAVMGIDRDKFERVIPVARHLVEGDFSLQSDDAVIGVVLASDLGVGVGDRVRVQTAEGGDRIFTVAGLIDMGNQQINERWLIVPLRTGQMLLGLGGGVSTIYADVQDIFTANERAVQVEQVTGLAVDDWMSTNAQLLIGLRSQSQSTNIIRLCVMFAVAISIASVLVVSVVQRAREIGILRAMGVPAPTLGFVFVIQGALVGIGGWLSGASFAALLVAFFSKLAVKPDGSPLFPIVIDAPVFLGAGVLSVVVGAAAAVFPARRAGRLDPAVAIRHV